MEKTTLLENPPLTPLQLELKKFRKQVLTAIDVHDSTVKNLIEMGASTTATYVKAKRDAYNDVANWLQKLIWDQDEDSSSKLQGPCPKPTDEVVGNVSNQ